MCNSKHDPDCCEVTHSNELQTATPDPRIESLTPESLVELVSASAVQRLVRLFLLAWFRQRKRFLAPSVSRLEAEGASRSPGLGQEAVQLDDAGI